MVENQMAKERESFLHPWANPIEFHKYVYIIPRNKTNIDLTQANKLKQKAFMFFFLNNIITEYCSASSFPKHYL